MKKFLGNLFIFLIVILVSLAAVPWNDIGQWAVAVPFLTNYEMYIKGGIGGFSLIIGLIYLIIANKEYSNHGYINRNTARAAFLPLYIFTISILVFSLFLVNYMFPFAGPTVNKLALGIIGIIALNLIIFGHIFGSHFKTESNGKRIAHFVLLFEFAAIAGGFAFWFYNYKLVNYPAYNSYYLILAAGVGILLYIVHIIITSIGSKKNDEIEEMEEEIEGLVDEGKGKPQSKVKHKGKKGAPEKIVKKDSKNTMIVSNQQTIVSSQGNIDPTNMIYEDVKVDPEFTKTNAPTNQPNSIEYYIEKPKMFKPLDPTFDELVAYVREMPNVVTKLDDDRITFYVDRKPFLVLMNLGNYYRMAFKYDLEKGIRLIIKYPTISKNKSSREELWFKANNYGDIPKDVIYQIVKYSYDNVNA